MPEPDHRLEVGSGSHAVQTARAMEGVEQALDGLRPDLAFVSGDVNSTLAAALVFAKLEVPYAHIESGLRSFDRSMPEEINRIVADEFADVLFTHSDEAGENLAAEGIDAARVHLVGNTMIDSLVAFEERFRSLGTCRTFGLDAGRVPARHAPPAHARRRPRPRRRARPPGGARGRPPGALPRPPADAGAARRGSLPAHPLHRPARLPRVPLGRGRRARRPHRLRRRAGGDDLPRGALLHAAEHDRAPGDDPQRHERPPRARARARPRRTRAPRVRAGRGARAAACGTGERPSAPSTSWSPGSACSRIRSGWTSI